MNYKIMPQISRKKLAVTLALAVIIFAAIGAFSYITIPFAAAFYAAILLLERNRKPLLSVIVSAVAIIIDVLINKAMATSSVQFIIAGIFIMLAVRYRYRKSSLSAILTAVFVGFAVINLIIFAALDSGEYSISSVFGYYLDAYNQLKAAAVDYFTKLPINSGGGAPQYLTSETVEALIDSFFQLVISFFVIFGFILAGITIKCFTSLSVRIVEDEVEIRRWRFTTGNLFAYTYAVLAFLNLFVSGSSIAAITINNLYLILLVPYSYIGFKFLLGYIKFSDRRFTVLSILVISVIVFGFYVFVPLSLFGTYAVIVTNKYSHKTDEENG